MSGQLILGLGGLGTALVGQASDVLSGRLSASRMLCAAIDTDKTSLSTLAGRQCHSHLMSLQMAEKLLLNAGEWEHLVPPGVRPELRRSGCGAIRMLGRLVFLTNYVSLAQWLNPLLTEVLEDGAVQLTLIGSLSGGTASVLLCELPFLLRGLIEQLKPGATLNTQALLIGSAKPARHERGASNAYATLIELNHWQAADTTYTVSIPGGLSWQTEQPPYDRVVMFSCRDLEDPQEKEALGRQLTAYLGLSLWTPYGPLADEVLRRQQTFAGEGDEQGNPVTYFSLASSSLSLPFNEIRTALASRILQQVTERWQAVITRPLEEGESPKSALEFLHREALARHVFLEELTAAVGGTTAFRHNVEVATLREELERKLPQGAALMARLATLEEALVRALGENRPDGLFARISARAAELTGRGVAALTQEVNAFFRSERSLGYAVYLEQLSDAVGDRLRTLYEEMSQLELDELRLLQEKEQMLRQLETQAPGKLKGVFKRKKGHPSKPPILDLIDRFYQSRLMLHIHREAWNAFQELLLLVERFRSDVTSLHDYLGNLGKLFQDAHNQAMGQIFSVPGEVLLSRAEVNDFLEDRASDKKSDKATRWVREELGLEPIELPQRYALLDAVAAMIGAVARHLGGLEGIDAVDQFFMRYRGAAAEAQLKQLFHRARPALQPRQHLEGWSQGQEVAFVAVHAPPGEETPGHQKLAEFLLTQKANLSVVPFLNRERLVFLRMVGGFPLRALELAPLHSAYLNELKGAKIAPHSRMDGRWHALARPSAREREQLWETLAAAVRLGHLEAGDTLESVRWPEMTSVTSSLYLYHDAEEGLLTQSSFLSALARWQEEKLDELGVESYLRQLEQESESSMLLGVDLAPCLARAADRLKDQLRQSWPEWDGLLSSILKHAPSLSEADLVQIPAGYRRWAMQRYEQSHPDENLAFHPGAGRLELVSARDLSHLEADIRKLSESQEMDPDVFARAADEILDFFCQTLGFTPRRPLGLGTIWGRMVENHGLRVRIPPVIPFLACQRPVLGPSDVAHLRNLLEQVGQDNRFGFLLVTSDKEGARSLVSRELSSLLRYDIIVLTPDDLKAILREQNRLSSLMRHVLEQVDLTVVSPFVTEGPVPASMFFGREGEIKEIHYRLDHSNVTLIGPRRVGKTSVLQRVLGTLRKQDRPVFYLDCQALSKGSDFLLSLASEHLPGWDAKMSFPAILMEMQHRHEGKQVLIILDEIDLMLSQDPANAEFLGRAFRQATTEGKACFLLCGERTLHHRLHQPDSAFYNFSHCLKLGFLSQSEATSLITEPLEQMEVRFEEPDLALEMLLYVSAGHPNLIQRACSLLVDRLNRERTRLIETDLLREVLTEAAFAEEYLETLWGSSGMRERIASLTIELDEEITAQDLRKRLETDFEVPMSLPELVESLDNLCLFGLLERHGPRYRLAVRSFPEMVGQVMDVREGVELYREMMASGG